MPDRGACEVAAHSPGARENFPGARQTSGTSVPPLAILRGFTIGAKRACLIRMLPSSTRPWRTRLLVLAMVLAIGGIAGLGVMDERSMASGIRREISHEQRVLAEVLAKELRGGLASIGGAGPPLHQIQVEDGTWRFGDGAITFTPRDLLHGEAFSESGEHRALLWSASTRELRTLDGELVSIPTLAQAAAAGETNAWLTPAEAGRLGLPDELAVAGLARIHTDRTGEWTLAIVGSIHRQRGREARRYARSVVMVSLASLIVIGFGFVLLRTQRQERALERALAREATRAEQEAQLAREGRAATMLTFAAGIAHELSTPLGVIAMRAEQLANNADDDRGRRGARAIGEQVIRIQEQSRRFLAIARGAAPLRERVPAGEVMHNAAARVQHRFDHAGVALAVADCSDLPWIHGDARLLEHSLTNLLINACDASPAGHTVELDACVHGDALELRVSDRGVGVDPVLGARIRPFFSTKAEGEGTGLGLAIASEVMRMHRGELLLLLRPGGGTCAVLRLPAEAAPTEEHAIPREPQDPPAARG